MKKINREDMKVYINNLMNEISINKDYSLELISSLKNRVSLGKIQNMLYQKNAYVEISDGELFWVLKGLDNLKQNHKIQDSDMNIPKLEKDFTEREIYEFESIYIKVEKEETNILELDGVTEVEPFKMYFMPKISGRKLKEIFDSNFAIYNFDTQREPNIKDITIAKVFIPTINKSNINAIKSAMRNRTFVPNVITLNVLCNGNEKFDFKEEVVIGEDRIGKFLFEKGEGSILNIVDGFHRCTALFELLNEDENFDFYMHLKITVFTVQEAQNYIRQESLGMKISELTQKRFDFNLYSETVKQINTLLGAEHNVLFNRISNSTASIDSNICTYDVFIDSLTDWYSIEKIYDARNVARYIIDFYNELSYLLCKDFENINESRKVRVTMANNMFVLYNYLSYKIKDKEDWVGILERVVCEIDFRKTNPLWDELKIESKRNEKRIRRKIYEYLDKVLMEVQ